MGSVTKTSLDELAGAMMPLIRQLADGQPHSGETLGNLLGVSRTAVWKQLKKLELLGLQVQSIKGVGYQLTHPLDLISESELLNTWGSPLADNIDLHLLPCVDSTNSFVAKRLGGDLEPQFAPGSVVVCSAEMQTAGRGRRGRRWHSPFAGNLYISIGKQIDGGIAAYEGLSLAAGLVIVESLTNIGVQGLGLKWPNDILLNGKKLAGILIEVDGDFSGICNLVVGIGINYLMHEDDIGHAIDQPWAQLANVMDNEATESVTRSQILALIVSEVESLITSFAVAGFNAYRQRWNAYDAYRDKLVVLSTASDQTAGVCRGVTETGALIIDIDGESQSFSGGEVSLRVSR